MKIKILLSVLLAWPLLGLSQENINFAAYFENQTMRVDVFHSGDAKEERFTIDRIFRAGPLGRQSAPHHRSLRPGPLPAAGERCGFRHPDLQQGLRQLFRRIQDHRTGSERDHQNVFRNTAHAFSQKQGPPGNPAARPAEPSPAAVRPGDRSRRPCSSSTKSSPATCK